MFGKVDGKKMTEDMVAAARWLKGREDCTGKIAATGFCYGGGIANTLAVRLGADPVAQGPEQIRQLVQAGRQDDRRRQ